MPKRSDFRLIGDPHITRKYQVGVPLARRGEREISLFNDFKGRLYEGDEQYVIMVGDLYEKPVCSLADVFNSCQIILDAAAAQPHREFFMMAGNHDRSPESDNPGAFDILKLFDGMLDNLIVVTEPLVYDGLAMFPWQWGRTALEQLEDVKGETFNVAIGHWDLVAYDDMHMDHFCPAAKLVEMGAEELYSGHWHVAGDYKVEGHTVHCTGSMQPMTHAEDSDGGLFVTLSLEEYNETDPATLKDKYVRVIADKDDEVDALSDCLGFKVSRSTHYEDDTPVEVEIEKFDSNKVIDRNLKKHDVPKDVATFIKERIDASD